MNEHIIETLIELGHRDLAEQINGESDYDARHAVRISGHSLPDDLVEWASDPVIESPSGWSFRETQENGDQVDCIGCGNSLNDDYPIENDLDGYAGHPECL